MGHNIGETFDINVKFPEQYGSQELAGKDAVFTITIHSIKVKELPALDDEFAKDVSDEFDSVDMLKDGIKKSLTDFKAQNAEREFEDNLLNVVIEDIEVEVPEVMVERQIDNLVNDFGRRLQQQGMNIETYMQITQMKMEDFRKNFAEAAERNVKITLALEAVVKAEKIEASDDDYEVEVKKLAEETGLEIDMIKSHLVIDDVKRDIAMNRAIDLIKENAKVKEVKETTPKATKAKADKASAEDKPAKKPAAKKETVKKEPAEKKTTTKKATKKDDVVDAEKPKKKPATKKAADKE